MTRASVHVSLGHTPDETNHVIVEIEGRWTAVARHTYIDEFRASGAGALVIASHGDGRAYSALAWMLASGWRADAIAAWSAPAAGLARRALQRLPLM